MPIPILTITFAGWRWTLHRLWQLLLHLIAALIRRLRRRRTGQRDYRDVNCLTPPEHIRARPDPFIYSQQWLAARGLAVTWDNPDFRIIDPITGAPVDRFALKANADYRVEATIHNGSLMVAFATTVAFDVREFGAGTGVVASLGAVALDVPAMGSAVASIDWHTPASGGHNCLVATISHPDDANPLNNVGQHNTDIARPASPRRRIRFRVGNRGRAAQTYTLRMDSYRLPERARCPRTYRERKSIAYLRRLQAEHDASKLPVPQAWEARLSTEALEIEADGDTDVFLELNAPSAEEGSLVVNVNAFAGEALVGGITAVALPEES